jgi:hypothetical protein
MPRGKGIYDDEDAETQAEDQGRDGDTGSGDTASEENTPDVAKTDQEPTA